MPYHLALMIAGLAAISLLLLLLWMVRWMGRRNRSAPFDPSLWDGRDYQCPMCRTPMEQGWVLLGRGAIWSRRGSGSPGSLAHIGQTLENTLSMSLPPASNMAWRCASCRMLLVDHDKLVRRGD